MSAEDKITHCKYKIEEVGKYIMSTKLKHVWEFAIDGKFHSIEFTESKITNKKKLVADRQTILPAQA
jgi:hypothetical protein